jgi:murein DD-endopeptidase MepM/ murein hydrolase activator NlpD
VPVSDATARGLLGGAVKWVGDRTGIKPISKAGNELDNASRGIKKEVPIYGTIEEGLSRPVRETGRWIERHPEEALTIAAVVAVGWAACVDGCALVGSILLDGAAMGGAAGTTVAVPLIAIEAVKKEPPAATPSAAQPPAKPAPEAPKAKPKASDASNSTAVATVQLDEVYMHKYSKKEYPNGSPPVIVYRSLNERLGEVFNEFAPPSSLVSIRVSDPDDTAGGIFTSPRKESSGAPDIRRIHAATDFLMPPGHPVLAPMTGKIDRIGNTGTADFRLVQIVSQDGTVARVLYVKPDAQVQPGLEVKAGVTRLGVSDNLSRSTEYSGVPNHVHVDFTDFRGQRFDPWTNQRTRPTGGGG